MSPGRDWTGWLGSYLLSLQCPITQHSSWKQVFFLRHPPSSLSCCTVQPCLSVMKRSPSLYVPLFVPWHVWNPRHWVLWGGGDPDGTQKKPQSFWVILKWNLLFFVSTKAQKETGDANKQTKCFKAVSSSLLFLLLQREPSHHLSISVTLWFCGNCHFPLLRFPRP